MHLRGFEEDFRGCPVGYIGVPIRSAKLVQVRQRGSSAMFKTCQGQVFRTNPVVYECKALLQLQSCLARAARKKLLQTKTKMPQLPPEPPPPHNRGRRLINLKQNPKIHNSKFSPSPRPDTIWSKHAAEPAGKRPNLRPSDSQHIAE
jgi:hypothetical protein